jgi:hypothetical protein
VRRWLRSSARFGSEVVARLLGLRKNHEARNDALELLPNDTSTRAEAAFSAAQILRFRHGDTSLVETLAPLPRREFRSAGVSPKRGMASPLPRPTIGEVPQGKDSKMLEWKTRILTLMIAFLPFWDRLGEVFDNNWNW